MLGYSQVIDYPEISEGERNVTNHASGGYEERRPNGLTMQGDFVISMIETPGVLSTLKTDMEAETERVSFLKDPVGGMIFTAWIKSVKREPADAQAPNSSKLTVTVTPVGKVTIT
jgi:hypothetical protein